MIRRYRADVICHHGIKGQKWGVRRYQNPDGTLTEAGKKRYSSASTFNATKRAISKRMTNNYDPIDYSKMMRIDGKTVRARAGNLSDSEFSKCTIEASKLFRTAAEKEPLITNDVVNAVKQSGGHMYGLEHRLKTPTSLAGKIASDSINDGVSMSKAADGIKDAVRYTSILHEGHFVSEYKSINKNLERQGYTQVRCKNFFDAYANGKALHKSIQCIYKDPSGYRFEFQFQTVSSQAAKELKVPIYEERRQNGISKERADILDSQMIALAEQVKNPKGIFSIKSY